MSYVDVINDFIELRGYSTYLEISSSQNCSMRSVRCDAKISVNPDQSSSANFKLDSDTFFSRYGIYRGRIDVIFIDGVHLCENVLRDISNALSFLSPGGVIVIHDCVPANEEHASRERCDGVWNGDVWKAVASYFATSPYCCYTYDVGFGCAVIDTSKQREIAVRELSMSSLTWDRYLKDKTSLLNIVSYKPLPSIKINYTAYLVNDWVSLFARHMYLLKKTVLSKHSANLSIFAYPRNYTLFKILDKAEIQSNVTFTADNMYEFPAIRDIVYNRADVNLYFHTKSVTRRGNRNCDCWERYLTEFNIARADTCMRGLDTYDCVGAEFRKTPFIHYSGNFWWARGSHLAKLSGSNLLSDEACKTGDRYACERLLCSADGTYLSLINSGSEPSLYNDYFCNDGDWDNKPSHSFTIKDGVLIDPDNAAV